MRELLLELIVGLGLVAVGFEALGQPPERLRRSVFEAAVRIGIARALDGRAEQEQEREPRDHCLLPITPSSGLEAVA